MQTTVELSDQELADLTSLTHESNVDGAVRIAIKEYIRYALRQQLKALSGKVQMDESWQQLEAAELRNGHANSGSGVN